jgi:hypothetical protein
MDVEPNLRRLAVSALLAGWIACTAFCQTASPKRVLLVFHGDGLLPADFVFEQSLAQSLRAAVGRDLEFYREQLDSDRFPEYKQKKIAELRSQYANRKIDAVIFEGNTSDEILPGVPVVQVSNFSSDPTVGGSSRGNFVFVSLNIDIRQTVDAARTQLAGSNRKRERYC